MHEYHERYVPRRDGDCSAKCPFKKKQKIKQRKNMFSKKTMKLKVSTPHVHKKTMAQNMETSAKGRLKRTYARPGAEECICSHFLHLQSGQPLLARNPAKKKKGVTKPNVLTGFAKHRKRNRFCGGRSSGRVYLNGHIYLYTHIYGSLQSLKLHANILTRRQACLTVWQK